MINIKDYIQGLFDLEIVTEVFILEMKPKEGESCLTEYVVSATDLFDNQAILPVQDKHFTISNPCAMFSGLQGFQSEFLEDTDNQLPTDSPYQGYRWHIFQ